MPSGTTARKTAPLLERHKIISLVREAVANGARKGQACRCIGISIRTLQRWTNGNIITTDRRSDTVNSSPRNKLSEAERLRILELCNSPEFASLPPNVIVPTLADRGIYIASESSFYRVLKSAKQLKKRSRECQYKLA